MTTVDYTGIRAKVSAAMTKVAQGEIKLAVVTPGDGPPHNPGPPTIAFTTLHGAATGITKQYEAQAMEVGADMIVKTAVVDGITPKLDDYLSVDGIRRNIVKFEPKPAAGTAVQWIFFVKGTGIAVEDDEEA